MRAVTAETEQLVQALKVPPAELVSPPHGWVRARRVLRSVLQLVGLVSLGVALYTLHAQGQTATCLNDTLANRSTPVPGVRSDAQAHIDFAKALDDALNAPKPSQSAKVKVFKSEVPRYEHDLQANQAARDAHPLGRC